MAMPMVPKSHWVLTRDDFIAELEKELAATKKRRIAKYDKGAKKYGGDVNLFDRNFAVEMRDERDDYDNYALFDRVKERKWKEVAKS